MTTVLDMGTGVFGNPAREIALVRPKLMILVGGLAIKLLYPAKAKLKDVVGTR